MRLHHLALTILAAALLTIAVWAAACTPPTVSPEPTRNGASTPRAAAPTGVPPRSITPTPAATSPSGAITLTWWLPDFLSPQAAGPAGVLLTQHLAAFEKAQAGKTHITTTVKARHGKGGLLDYLRTTAAVAPGIQPDLIALDVSELEQAASLGSLVPLESLLEPQTLAALYPFARQTGQFGGKQIAVQILADFEHVIYDRGRIEGIPLAWADLIAGKTPILIPLGAPKSAASSLAEESQLALLSQYLAAGAPFDPKTRRVGLAEQPLLRLLTLYAEARDAGVFPKSVTEVGDADQVWKSYVQGQAPAAVVSARRYLAERKSLPNADFATLPGLVAPAPPIADGWALAIVATEPTRQRAAAQLLTWLLEAERAGPWTQTLGWLPTTPQALTATGSDPYYEFLNRELAAATGHPAGADLPQIVARLQQAVAAVAQGANPTTAAQTALNPK